MSKQSWLAIVDKLSLNHLVAYHSEKALLNIHPFLLLPKHDFEVQNNKKSSRFKSIHFHQQLYFFFAANFYTSLIFDKATIYSMKKKLLE